ncbi:MAG: hypothetical protein FJ100_23745 [Deltaproteobacteria bacterium]|nr:hypothetical protein [Deltaproteobacteria bacterium]
MIDKLKSRKLVASVCAALLVVLNRKLGLGLDATDLATLAGLAAAYVIGQGVADHGKASK